MTTAAQAVADFRAGNANGRIIGYCYAPGAAQWFALDASGAACGPDGPLNLDAVFEMHATDGSRELRWLRTAAGFRPNRRASGHPATGSAAAPAPHAGRRGDRCAQHPGQPMGGPFRLPLRPGRRTR